MLQKKLASFLRISALETYQLCLFDCLCWKPVAKSLSSWLKARLWNPGGNRGAGQRNSKHASGDRGLAHWWGWQAQDSSTTYRGGDGGLKLKSWWILNLGHFCQEQQKGRARKDGHFLAVSTCWVTVGPRWWFVPCALRFRPASSFKTCS